jgi:hypothetical protein
MTLEEVAVSINQTPPCFITDDHRKLWHRAITAHIEGEPRGLTRLDIHHIKAAAEFLPRNLEPLGQLLRAIAARHTKGGKQ